MQAPKEFAHFRLDRNLEMPSVPVVISKILQLVDEDRASARRLEELIQHDPSLSVRILKLSNSAFYSFRSEVRTIAHAIALLGLNLVRSLTIGVSIFESFTKGMREQAALINQLWMHSVGVGFISQEIWNRRSTRAQGEFALLCGLLHDLGKVVYFKQDAAGYSRLFAMKKGPDDPDICAHELQHYGVDHATLGSLLASQWHLPQELATAVQYHHEPGAGGFPLAAAISIADMLVKQAGIGNDGDCKMIADVSNLQGLLKMDPEEFDSLSVLAASKRADVEEFFQLMKHAG
jgi:putative nucleotidyltransferase with HDIG domain